MAKYEITFSCGHTATVELVGKMEDREHKIAYFQEHGVCPNCYHEQQETGKSTGCDEITVSYRDYKNDPKYADCKTKSGSYDAKAKTIVVYVPHESEPEPEKAAPVDQPEPEKASPAKSVQPADIRKLESDVLGVVPNMPEDDRAVLDDVTEFVIDVIKTNPDFIYASETTIQALLAKIRYCHPMFRDMGECKFQDMYALMAHAAKFYNI